MGKELEKYLKTGLSKGHPKDLLKEHLVKSGWEEKEIDKSFKKIYKNKMPPGLKFITGFQYFLIFAFISLGIISWVSISQQISASELNFSGLFGFFIFLFLFLLSIIPFFSARGIIRKNNGWRIAIIVFASIALIQIIFSLLLTFIFAMRTNSTVGLAPIFTILIVLSGICIYHIAYLGFNKNSKEWFNEKAFQKK